MRLYVFNRYLYGMSVAVAHSKAEAFTIMVERGLDRSYAPDSPDEIEEWDIVDGLLIENHGDR